MIDMDDVITLGTFQRQIEEYIGHPIDYEKTGYFLQNALEDKKDEFFKKGPLDMYEDAPLMEGAYEVLMKCNEKYDMYIVTAYNINDAPNQIGNHLKYKMKYLQDKLPFIKVSQIIFCNNKKLIDFDIVVDDSLNNLESGKKKLLFTAYHNQKISKEELDKMGIIRVNNWQEISEILLEEVENGKTTESNS